MKPPPDPVCACGHPRACHHPTTTGRITYCTVWTSAIGQCPCKTYTPQE